MRFVAKRVYVGPNRYALYPVVRLTIDLGIMEDYPSSAVAGFTERLLETVPSLSEHGCCFREHGGFVRRLRKGTWMGHIIEHVAIALQNLAGLGVSFGKTRGTGTKGEYHIVYSAPDGDIGLDAGETARRIVESAITPELAAHWGADPREIDAPAEIGAFLGRARRRQLGPSTRAIVDAAEARGIPWRRLDHLSFIRLGSGVHQRRIRATVTDDTSSLGVSLACNKDLCGRILRDGGLPVPDSRMADDADAAVAAAEAIGYPVVLKPHDGNHGRGVTLAVEDEQTVREAFERAAALSEKVLVESYFEGADHRLLVIGGRLVAAARRVPATIVGDGSHTVAELVDQANQDARRGEGHENVLTRIALDEGADRMLARHGLTRDSVPEKGARVQLQQTANLSTGGTAIDVTDSVHPDNARLAVRAARLVDLDVAGIDFLTPDIGRSWREQPSAICEVNAAPGFRMHVAPTEGEPRPVGEAVIDTLFPPGTPTAVPTLALTGTNGKTTTARMLAHLYSSVGKRVGLTTTDGVYIDGERTVKGDMTGPRGARTVLDDPYVEVAVLEVARGGIAKRGMGVRSVDVGALMNVSSDHLGMDGVDDLDDLAFVKSAVPKVATGTAVLNADDPRCLKWMKKCRRAQRVCLVSRDPSGEAVREHTAAGGPAVVLEADRIALCDGAERIDLVGVAEMPATLGGAVQHNVDNAMFAAAMAWCQGLEVEAIQEGLCTFRMSYETTPGRMNVYDAHRFRVILDYGHNPAGYRAMADVVDRLSPDGQRIIVFGTRASRRDEDIRACAREVAGHFDLYICRGERKEYGRPRDEVPRMQREELLAAGVAEGQVRAVVEEPEAIARALSEARPGDLVVVFAADVAGAWEQIQEFRYDESGVHRRSDAGPAQKSA